MTLDGVMLPVTTPFDGDAVAPSRLADNIARYETHGVAGYLLLGSTGEAPFLEESEKVALMRAARAAIPASSTLLAGAGLESTAATIRLTKLAADAKFGLAYQMTPPLKELIDQTLRDGRWDMTYLGMQVVIEGLALAAFQTTRDYAQNPLAQQVNAYVMQDESRHVAFGRLALRDYYPKLTQKERDEREQFLVEACYLMRDRFESREVWATLGLPVEECVAYVNESPLMKTFRNGLFMRIVPIVKDIGL